MSFIIREKWVWMTIGLCILVLVGPYALMLLILHMPSILGACFVWMLIFSSGIAAGYKDWRIDKKKRGTAPHLPE
jgi:hypothetical protein